MKQIKIRFLKNQQGISLLEVLLSLGIIAIILVMATKYFFVANRNNKINVVREQIGEIVSATEAWKGQNATYNAGGNTSENPKLSINTLYQQGFLAKSNFMVMGTAQGTASVTSIHNPWGFAIDIENITATGLDIKTQLPGANECTALMNSYPNARCDSANAFTLSLPIENKSQ